MHLHKESQGFPDGVIAEVQVSLTTGDQQRAQAAIAKYPEYSRAELRAQGVDFNCCVPEIGKQIKWSVILRQVFRVLEFDRATTTLQSDGTPKAETALAPHGHLLVESPIFNQPIRLPIIHSVDFHLARSVFDSTALSERLELLVTYSPKRTFLGGRALGNSHVLHYVICPRGTIQSYYDFGNGIHRPKPALEKLFGTLRYSYLPGQMKVGWRTVDWRTIGTADWRTVDVAEAVDARQTLDVTNKKMRDLTERSCSLTARFDAVLEAYSDSKIGIIKAIAKATGLGLYHAQDLTEGSPVKVSELSLEAAETLKKAMEEAGAHVSIMS